MRLSDLVANLTPSIFAQIALLLFVAVFAAVGYRAYRRAARTQSQQWAELPLCDDATATTADPGADAGRDS
jgi:cbb3-type cytochrome oxidase subunit 3